MDFLSMLGVVGMSSLFGVVKSYTRAMDGKIGAVIKPFQPVLIALAGIGLPFLTQALGLGDIDPAVFVTAPTTTIAIIAMREGRLRAQGKKKKPQAFRG